MWDRGYGHSSEAAAIIGGDSLHSSLSSSGSGSTETLRRWLADEDVRSVEAELLAQERQRQEKKRQKARDEQLRNNHTTPTTSSVSSAGTTTTTTTVTTSPLWSMDGMQPSLFDSGQVGIYHAGGGASSSCTSPALSNDGSGPKRSGLESSDEWNLPAASRYAPSEVATYPGTASPLDPRHHRASSRHAMHAMMDYYQPPYSNPFPGTFDAAPPASSNGTNDGSHFAILAAPSGWDPTPPAHNAEPRHVDRRQKEEWEMFLNDNMDEAADEGRQQEQRQQQVAVGRRATTTNWLAGAHLTNMRLALAYRDIYAKYGYDEALQFFWSISPLAPAAMTEELVRLALTSPDGVRDDYPLTLNVYVCLAVGATHCGNAEMAKQMLERARWTLSEVFDNPDYNVAQALYVLAIHVLYYECDVSKCGYYMSLAINICRSIGMLNSDTFLRCTYGVSFLPTTSAKDLIRHRREYLNARRLPYQRSPVSVESLERAELPMISAVDRGNSIGMLLLNVMAGVSLFKARAAAQPSSRGEVGRRHLFPLLRALSTLEADLWAENEREGTSSEGRQEDSPVMGSDDTTKAGDDAESRCLPYMQRVSFLMCIKAQLADCARCIDRLDLALHSASGLLRIAKRNAHFMPYMYCGMQPTVTIAVEIFTELGQWHDLKELLDVTQPLATMSPLIGGLYASYAQALVGKALVNEPPPPVAAHGLTFRSSPHAGDARVQKTSTLDKRRRDDFNTLESAAAVAAATSTSPSSSPASSSSSSTYYSSAATPPYPDRPLPTTFSAPMPVTINSGAFQLNSSATAVSGPRSTGAGYHSYAQAVGSASATDWQPMLRGAYEHDHYQHQYRQQQQSQTSYVSYSPQELSSSAWFQQSMPPSGQPSPSSVSFVPQSHAPSSTSTSASYLSVQGASSRPPLPPQQQPAHQTTPPALFLTPLPTSSSSLPSSAAPPPPPAAATSALPPPSSSSTASSSPPRAEKKDPPAATKKSTSTTGGGGNGATKKKQSKDKWRWHKFAAVDGEEELVQFKEAAVRPRRPRTKKPNSTAGAPTEGK